MNKTYVLLVAVLSAVALIVAGWAAWGSAQGVGTRGPAQISAPVMGGCNLTRAKFKSAENYVHNVDGQTNWVNIPDMSLSFTITGTSATCVEVDFSAHLASSDITTLDIRALLDGVTVGNPSVVSFSRHEWFGGAHAFNFFFTGVTPGSHQVVMQWRVSDTADAGYMLSRSLVVRAP